MKTGRYAHLSFEEQHKKLITKGMSELDPKVKEVAYKYDMIPNDVLHMVELNIFHNIPQHYGYKINKLGIVFSMITNKVVEPTLNESGYWGVTVHRPPLVRSVTGRIHRLLALTFLTPMSVLDIGKLDVNHIDGDKTNNSLSNLEWATRKMNCDHAYRTGLRSDNTPIVVTNVTTGAVKEFYSMGEAGRFFGVTAAAIHWQLNKKLMLCSYKGHRLEYKQT